MAGAAHHILIIRMVAAVGLEAIPENPVYRAALGDKASAQINAKVAITFLGKILGNAAISRAAELI